MKKLIKEHFTERKDFVIRINKKSLEAIKD